jgi:hypothetical protein
VVSAVSAIFRAIGVASVHSARGRASHNPPVVGSSPTRPTYLHLRKPLIWPGWLVRGTAAVGNIQGTSRSSATTRARSPWCSTPRHHPDHQAVRPALAGVRDARAGRDRILGGGPPGQAGLHPEAAPRGHRAPRQGRQMAGDHAACPGCRPPEPHHVARSGGSGGARHRHEVCRRTRETEKLPRPDAGSACLPHRCGHGGRDDPGRAFRRAPQAPPSAAGRTPSRR